MGKSGGVRKWMEKRGQKFCGMIEICSDKSVWLLKSPGIKKCSENQKILRKVLKIFQKLEEQPLKTLYSEVPGKQVKTSGTPELSTSELCIFE
jgi:hypothetical protein